MLVKRLVLFAVILLGLNFKIEPVFLHVEGLVTVDGKPVSAEIEINSMKKNTKVGFNKATKNLAGNFITQLAAGDEYEIVVKVDRFPQQVINLNTLNLEATQSLNVFADFTSPEYDKKLEELMKSTDEILKIKKIDKTTFVANFGDTKKEELEFKVQIAAYKFFENFNYNNVLGLPKIIRKTDNDQITRFTMGNFATYNEALALLQNVQKSTLSDAFIIAVYKGNKKMLQQLLDEKIITPN